MQNPCVKLIISSIADGQFFVFVFLVFLLFYPPSARVRRLNSTALGARSCAECVHEGVKLLRIGEIKESSWS